MEGVESRFCFQHVAMLEVVEVLEREYKVNEIKSSWLKILFQQRKRTPSSVTIIKPILLSQFSKATFKNVSSLEMFSVFNHCWCVQKEHPSAYLTVCL